MVLGGFAYSLHVCSSFSRAQNKVIAMGFADDINTYVMISGGCEQQAYLTCTGCVGSLQTIFTSTRQFRHVTRLCHANSATFRPVQAQLGRQRNTISVVRMFIKSRNARY